MKTMYRFTLALSLILGLSSCNKRGDEDVTQFFRRGPKCGSSPDYAILQQSTLEPSRWDHVITVHGFVNDARVSQLIVDLLEQSGTDSYKTVQINK